MMDLLTTVLYHYPVLLGMVQNSGTERWYKEHLLDASSIGLSLRDNHLKSGAFSLCYRIDARGWTPLRSKRKQRSRKPPRYARPSPFRSRNSRHFAVRASHASMDSFSAYPEAGLVSPTRRFTGASPQNKYDRWGGLTALGLVPCFGSPALAVFAGQKAR